jgi:fumarylacetoacetase
MHCDRHWYRGGTLNSACLAHVGDYTDLYTSIYHATNVGRQFRPDNPLLPNYKWVPIGYHGRASSIGPSGQTVRRPQGQFKGPDDPTPRFGPTRRLDYELELGAIVAMPNVQSESVPIDEAEDHLVGLALFNDWTARDMQAWEYQPLGPFLSAGCWRCRRTPDALECSRQLLDARPAGRPSHDQWLQPATW